MPNYVHNSLTITGVTHEQWCDLATFFAVQDGESKRDIPKIFYHGLDRSQSLLSRTCQSTGSETTKTDPKYFNINQCQTHDFPFAGKPSGSNWNIHGFIINSTNEYLSGSISIKYSTAWSPPSEECIGAISMNFPGSLLTNYYHEECGDFCGVTIAKDGITRNLTDSVEKHYETFIYKKFPDLDEQIQRMGLIIDIDLVFVDNNSEADEFLDFICTALSSYVAKLTREIEEALTDSCSDP